jgi:endonuclease/exonuclease/phosphatase family metal-dependent hydrolase
MAILSKAGYEVEDIRYFQPDIKGSHFPVWIVRVSVNGNHVFLCNVHLRPPIGDKHLPTLTSYFTTSFIRKNEVKEALKVKKELALDRFVIIGDFNEGHTSSACEFLHDTDEFTDALRLYCEKESTWIWPLAGSLKLWGAYDHCFYTHCNLKAIGCRVMQEYEHASDHLPVVITLELI